MSRSLTGVAASSALRCFSETPVDLQGTAFRFRTPGLTGLVAMFPASQVPFALGLGLIRTAAFDGRFFAGLLKTKRPYRTHPFIPGSQGNLFTFWQTPLSSCGQPQLLILPPVAPYLLQPAARRPDCQSPRRHPDDHNSRIIHPQVYNEPCGWISRKVSSQRRFPPLLCFPSREALIADFAITTVPGSGGFTLTTSPGGHPLRHMDLDQHGPLGRFPEPNALGHNRPEAFGVSLFDSGSKPSTPDSGPGIPGVVYLSGVAIGGSTNLLPWADESHLAS